VKVFLIEKAPSPEAVQARTLYWRSVSAPTPEWGRESWWVKVRTLSSVVPTCCHYWSDWLASLWKMW
jgi:hypothetical protein